MVFKRPSFEILKANTYKLDARLSSLLGRYIISTDPPASEEASLLLKRNKPNTLEILIARTNQVVTCATDRVAPRDVFNQLSNELREVLKEGDEEKIKQGALFLLGALLHRYFRLLHEEVTYSCSLSFFSVTMYYAKNCRLFLAIRDALHLPQMSDSYREDDLKKLDVATVVTALECFRDNMLLNERYKKYPHFNQDKNFQVYLQAIIDEQRKRDSQSNILGQFKAIHFLQSLLINLEIEQQKIEKALNTWLVRLKKDYPQSSELRIELVEQHLLIHIEEPLREKIADLLYTPYIKEKFASLDHTNLVMELNICHIQSINYILFGGYALIDVKNKHENLLFCLHHALGVEKKENELTHEDRMKGIEFLGNFIEETSDIELNVDYFGGLAHLKTEILQQQLNLKTQLAITPREARTDSPVMGF
ncbi:MAG: type IV secretion protein Dot [bacterium]|nr:type IV secretion protein Dot [bacterium]